MSAYPVGNMGNSVSTARRCTARIILAILSFLAILAGCSNGDSKSTLDEVRDSKVLRVGTEGTYSPFSYHDPGTNQLTGYDIEVITAVAGKLGARPEFVEAPFDALFASLVSDRFDVVANQVTKNAAREAKYALSAPYTVSDGVIITRTDDSSITQLSDLQGKTTAQSATSNWAQVATNAGAKVERWRPSPRRSPWSSSSGSMPRSTTTLLR